MIVNENKSKKFEIFLYLPKNVCGQLQKYLLKLDVSHHSKEKKSLS